MLRVERWMGEEFQWLDFVSAGVVNPIRVAHSLMKESSQGCLPLGRVPPL